MKVEILRESGYDCALFGLGFNKGVTSEMAFADFRNSPAYKQMINVARRLAPLDDGHNKFLESIMVWLDIDAPRYWWQDIDAYRCPEDGAGGFLPTAISKQSESTSHTILRRELVQADFELPIEWQTLHWVNGLIRDRKYRQVKNELPEGFLQRREVVTNYKALRYIYQQRIKDPLVEWRVFCDSILILLERPEFIRA